MKDAPWWRPEFEELARYNGDKNRVVYRPDYVARMEQLQREFNATYLSYAQAEAATTYATAERFTAACRAFGREVTKVVRPPVERVLDWIARKL